jgi:tetratricopeptide (TPR) repeat protein
MSQPHLALQTALAEARAGRLNAAARALREAPPPLRDTPPYRLFAAWFAARQGRLDEARPALEALLAAVPENRVVATALAYVLLRQGALAPALGLLADPGDNLELLSWAWLEVERVALARPAPAEPPVPPLPPITVGPAAARRLFRAGVAAVFAHAQVVWRRRLLGWRLGAPLHGLLRAAERRWPTDALLAFRLADSAGVDVPDLAFHLGAQWHEQGYQEAALAALERAWTEAEARLGELTKDAPEHQRSALRRDWEATEEVCLVRLYRAAALVELRRWDEAETALCELAAVEAEAAGDDAGRTHEFAQPEWFVRRGRVRLARGQSEAARADLERALAGDPSLFAHRLRQVSALST